MGCRACGVTFVTAGVVSGDGVNQWRWALAFAAQLPVLQALKLREQWYTPTWLE
jgi:hypothetical protein